MPRLHRFFESASLVFVAGLAAQSPLPVLGSDIVLRATRVGVIPSTTATYPRTDATSPAVVAGQLLVVEQRGYLYRRDAAGRVLQLLGPTTVPPTLNLLGERILNVAANATGDRVYVVFMSSVLPPGVQSAPSPRPNATAYQIVYEYAFDGISLTSPRVVTAFDAYPWGHTGGGMLVAPNGAVLLAIGDNGDAGEDGRAFSQDDVSHLGKIVGIDPSSGAWTILAKGVRNVQRMELAGARVVFTDIGGRIAEELDSIDLASLLDSSMVENFGWGRNASDGLAREGTFYIDTRGFATGLAPSPEPGFVQPVAQWGRESARFVAATGPVSGSSSLLTVDSLFGDLVSGDVFAIRGQGIGGVGQSVFRVSLVDSALRPTTLDALAGGRPDPRFFSFPDGRAGVLLERTGELFDLEELSCGTASQTITGVACGAESIGVSPDAARLGGGAMTLCVNGGTVAQTAALLFDLRSTAAPVDLSPIGMPGCAWNLRSPFTIARGFFDAAGSMCATLATPTDPVFCALQGYVQGVAASPAANALGDTTTELLTLRFGL